MKIKVGTGKTKKLYDLERDGVTQSVLIGWLKCRRSTKLSLIEGWTPTKPKTTFIFGDLTHGVLEDIYGSTLNGECPDREQVVWTINKRVKQWLKEHDGFVSEDLQEAIELDAAKLEAVLPAYFEHWAKQDWGETKWVSLEEEFEIKIEIGLPWLRFIIVRGKMDGLYKRGGLCLFETKTKSMIDEKTLYDMLAFDFQTDLYSIAVEAKYGSLPILTRYNVIRKPSHKLGKQETLKMFTARLVKEIDKDKKHFFKRYRIERNRQHTLEFKTEIVNILREFAMWYKGDLPDYKNTNSCITKYGSCSMLPICSYGNYRGHHRRTEIFKELSYRRTEE